MSCILNFHIPFSVYLNVLLCGNIFKVVYVLSSAKKLFVIILTRHILSLCRFLIICKYKVGLFKHVINCSSFTWNVNVNCTIVYIYVRPISVFHCWIGLWNNLYTCLWWISYLVWVISPRILFQLRFHPSSCEWYLSQIFWHALHSEAPALCFCGTISRISNMGKNGH